MGGYVAGALASALLEGVLCLWFALRATGLKLQLFQWLTAPGLASLLAALTSNLLLRYRQIKQHVSPPMAKLVGNQCGGCFMTLPSASLKKIVSEDAVVECDNCGRILYAPEGE